MRDSFIAMLCAAKLDEFFLAWERGDPGRLM